MVGKLFAGILVDRVCKVTEFFFINDVQGWFRARKEYVNHVVTLKQVGEKAREKNVKSMWVL